MFEVTSDELAFHPGREHYFQSIHVMVEPQLNDNTYEYLTTKLQNMLRGTKVTEQDNEDMSFK